MRHFYQSSYSFIVFELYAGFTFRNNGLVGKFNDKIIGRNIISKCTSIDKNLFSIECNIVWKMNFEIHMLECSIPIRKLYVPIKLIGFRLVYKCIFDPISDFIVLFASNQSIFITDFYI